VISMTFTGPPFFKKLSFFTIATAKTDESIQNNCVFWRFHSPSQVHAFSNANPRKLAFPCIDPRDCKTFLVGAHGLLELQRDRLAWLKTGTPRTVTATFSTRR
jgi:hypothetical protein